MLINNNDLKSNDFFSLDLKTKIWPLARKRVYGFGKTAKKE